MNLNNKPMDSYFALFALGIGFLVLFFFGIFRIVSNEILIGSVDLFISFAVFLIFIQYWRSGHSEKLNLIFVVSYMTGALVLMLIRPSDILYWSYPIITATFFLVKLRVALIFNVVTIVATLGILWSHIPFSTEFASITATLILVCVFGYVFSARSEYHKKLLNTLATHDGLTNVGNRRSMDNRIEEAVTVFSRDAVPCSMIMLDLDHFKNINDTYGHAVGDKALVKFVSILRSATRVSDKIYRFGGEEFVIIADHTSLENAGKLAEDLRELVETNLLVNKEKNITVSIGVSELIKNDSATSWLCRADGALYKAKQTTRNTVYLAAKNRKDDNFRYIPVKQKVLISKKMREFYEDIDKDTESCKSSIIHKKSAEKIEPSLNVTAS